MQPTLRTHRQRSPINSADPLLVMRAYRGSTKPVDRDACWKAQEVQRCERHMYEAARAKAMRPVRWLAHFDRLAKDRKATRFDANRQAASFYDVLGERFNSMFARVAA